MKRVLIVDDSPTMRRMVMSSLRTLPDLQFIEAGNGLEAIEKLSIEAVALVILDLNMPAMHGLEVLRFVRSHQSFRDIPVIVLTTKEDEGSRRAALGAGATIYMTKPFEPQQLHENAIRALSGTNV